jgi:uncharacterized delta-60 repeat protein/uncharacterized repeat protein (TIGR01451 family)
MNAFHREALDEARYGAILRAEVMMKTRFAFATILLVVGLLLVTAFSGGMAFSFNRDGGQQNMELREQSTDSSASSERMILDPTFGTAGEVTEPTGAAYGVVLQPDGKIVAGGYGFSSLTYDDFVLARYNPDGIPDSSFGNNGFLGTDFQGNGDVGYALVQQPDGKLLLAGEANMGSVDFAVARYNPDGSLDTSWGGDGKVTTDFYGFNDVARAIAIQADGKVVVAGFAVVSVNEADFAIVRYKSDGSLDKSFNGDGKVTASFNYPEQSIMGIVIQPDGKLVVGGNYNYGVYGLVSRFNPDGSLDETFGNQGVAIPSPDFNIQAITIQADGKLLIGGYYSNHFAVGRLNPDGSPDKSFGGGIVLTGFRENPLSDGVYTLLVQPDQKILAAGQTGLHDEFYSEDFAIARYNSDCSLDTTFNGDGRLTSSIYIPNHHGRAQVRSLVIQPDGKLVAAGNSHPDNHFALTRYAIQSLTLDLSSSTASPEPGQNITYTIKLQNDGPFTLTNGNLYDALPPEVALAGPVQVAPPSAGIVGEPPNLVGEISLAVGQAVTVTVPVTVALDLAQGTVVSNQVSFTSTEVTKAVTASVSMVTPAPPIARDDYAMIQKNTGTRIFVLGNDSDPNGQALSLSAVGTAQHGSAVQDGNTVLYTPDSDFTGLDEFTYSVSDGEFTSDATVTVNVLDKVWHTYLPFTPDSMK